MEILKKLILIFITAAVLLTGCSGNRETVSVTIAEGSSLSQIADTLKASGLIGSRLIFKHKAKDKYPKPGTYNILTGTSVDDIVDILASGASDTTVTFTIPEGYSVQQIAKRAEELGICSEKDFLKAADTLEYDFAFLKNLGVDGSVKYKLQGFLYPNTYFVEKNTAAKEVVKLLLGEFENQLNQNNIPYDDLYRTVTVASLLQREALLDSEKAKIAGVIENRLKAGMLLQIDASVVYGVTDGQYNVTAVYNKDLKSNSPYNLYKYKGLPPGPICNPDITSIKAARSPEKHDYLYYRTDEKKNDGSHIFTKTYEEHLNANN